MTRGSSAAHICLPPGCINSDIDLATNAAVTPCPLPQSDIPHRMVNPSNLHFSTHDWEKNVSSSGEASLWRSEPEMTVSEKHLLRSRILQPTLLFQSTHHTNPEPSLPCNPALSTFFHDSSKEQEVSSYVPLQPSSSFQKLQDFRQSLLPQLPPHCALSFFESPSFWLASYFTLNLSLTLYNKSVLIHFPFPYTLTALHALCGSIGASILLHLQDPGFGGTLMNETSPKSTWPLFHKITPDLNAGELVVLLLFSMLYTINIAVSNASLRLVTVPFHQVVRASTPFFTIVFSLILLNKRCTKLKVLTLIPVVAGVCFATYGDYYFTPVGFFLTLLGTILAALKTILTNVILVKQPISPLPISLDSSNHQLSNDAPNQSSPSPSGLLSIVTSYFFNSSSSISVTNATTSIKIPAFTLPKLTLSPLQLLYLLSPLAFIQTTLLAHFTGELSLVHLHLFHTSPSHPQGGTANFRMWLVLNGVMAFFLNVVSFNANRRVGPLAMTVAANVKQVLTVLCAVFMFHLTITPANGLGILLTIVGGALYAVVELREKQGRRRWVR